METTPNGRKSKENCLTGVIGTQDSQPTGGSARSHRSDTGWQLPGILNQVLIGEGMPGQSRMPVLTSK